MIRPIINIEDVVLTPRSAANAAPGDAAVRFDARIGQIAAHLGAQKLGYNITAVPPGKRAFPLHSHRINEEMFFVIEGSGEIRIGATVHPIRAGDIIACPPGGPETAHQIINTGATDLKYLAVSTQQYPEICDYPDSGKFLVAERPRNADGSVHGFRHVGRADAALDYWDGE
jgi:uncharacterized cupin superfamily protein